MLSIALQIVFVAVCFLLGGVALVRWREEKARRAAAHEALAAHIGRRAVVTQPVMNEEGLVRINGNAYAACAENGGEIGPRVLVEVIGVHRYRLLVRRVHGQARLVDVDDLVAGREPPVVSDRVSGSGVSC